MFHEIKSKIIIIKRSCDNFLVSNQCFHFCRFFKERILVHVPSRRPSINDILSSQWINNQNIVLESAIAPTTTKSSSSKQTKKFHWFSPKRVVHSNTDSSQSETHFVQLFFNTKRANSVLDTSFLHPINVSACPDEANNVTIEKTVKIRHRSIFGNSSLKKKIGPMETKNNNNTKSNLLTGNRTTNASIDDKISISNAEHIQSLRKTVESSSKQHSISNTTDDGDDDEEQGQFVMAPSDTNSLNLLHPHEVEARTILEKLGITNEMLLRSIESGPRSDIIGAYRIIIHRLQRRTFLAKQHEIIIPEPPLIQRPKTERTCAIL